jgi:hypothetical protein
MQGMVDAKQAGHLLSAQYERDVLWAYAVNMNIVNQGVQLLPISSLSYFQHFFNPRHRNVNHILPCTLPPPSYSWLLRNHSQYHYYLIFEYNLHTRTTTSSATEHKLLSVRKDFSGPIIVHLSSYLNPPITELLTKSLEFMFCYKCHLCRFVYTTNSIYCDKQFGHWSG